MPLAVKPAKTKPIGLRTAFRLKLNLHIFIGFSIYEGVALRFIIARKFTGFCRVIYYTGFRHLGVWVRRQKGFKRYCP